MSNSWSRTKQRLEKDPAFAEQYRIRRRQHQRDSYARQHGIQRVADAIDQVAASVPINVGVVEQVQATDTSTAIIPIEVANTPPVVINNIQHIVSPTLDVDQIEVLTELLVELRETKLSVRTKDEVYREQLEMEVESLNVLIDWLEDQ